MQRCWKKELKAESSKLKAGRPKAQGSKQKGWAAVLYSLGQGGGLCPVQQFKASGKEIASMSMGLIKSFKRN